MGGVDSRDGAAIVVVILFVCCFFTSVQMWVFGDRQIRVVQGGLPGMTTYLLILQIRIRRNSNDCTCMYQYYMMDI